MILIALLLVLEGLSTGLWIARILPMLGGFSTPAIVLVVLRILVGATQLVGGVFIMSGRRSAVGLCRVALIGSAVLTTLEIGERITPNNLVPSLRWPLVIAYWLYALGAAAYLRYAARVDREWKVRADKNPEVQGDKTRDVQEDKNLEVLEEKDPEVLSGPVREPESTRTDNSGPPTGDPSESGERPRLFE